MRLTTSYGSGDGWTAAAVDWRFSASQRVPFDAINAALAAHYNLYAAGKGDPPYLYKVERGGKQVGLFVADITNVDSEGRVDAVDVSGMAGAAIFDAVMAEEAVASGPAPWTASRLSAPTAWREDMGLAVVRWELPDGQIFPVNCLNALLRGMYGDDDGYLPFFYPVFGSDDGSGVVPQIGALLSTSRDESGTARQFAEEVKLDFEALMGFGSHEKNLPWEQEVFDG